METSLLAAALRSRDSYDLISEHIDAKLSTYSKQFQVLMNKIGDYYKRDEQVEAVDSSVLLAQITETIRNPKHITLFTDTITEALAANVSLANVEAIILTAKMQEVGDKLSQALAADATQAKVDTLLDQLQDLRSKTSLAELEEEEIKVFERPKLSELVNKEMDPTNLIRLYPTTLNDRLDGGAKRGHHITILARPNCVAEDTVVRVKHNPTSTSPKKMTIKQFYNLVHGNRYNKGNGPYMLQSTADGKVFYNIVEDVIYSGSKECFKVVTEHGEFVEATADHVMLTDRGDVKLGDLTLEDKVVVDAYTKVKQVPRKEITTKLPYSPYRTRVINGCTYHRVPEYRLAYDAYANGYDRDSFIKRLKEGGDDALVFAPSHMDIHHINLDPTDSSKENLQLLTHEEHLAIHSAAGDNGNSHRAEYSKVISIESVGIKECYDISMNDKANNFRVNNGMYVHNCGKSAFCINLTCGFLAQGFRVLYLINEDREEDIYMRHIYNLSNMDKWAVMNDPDEAEAKALRRGIDRLTIVGLAPGSIKQIEDLIEAHTPDVVIVDQLRNLIVKAENRTGQLDVAARSVRNLAKKLNVLMISVTQAGDSAADKAILDMGDCDSSNTGIPAACDVMLGIGKDATLDAEGRRMISLMKNKLGREEHFPVNINPTLSRYTNV